jgi:hypothetical protein
MEVALRFFVRNSWFIALRGREKRSRKIFLERVQNSHLERFLLFRWFRNLSILKLLRNFWQFYDIWCFHNRLWNYNWRAFLFCRIIGAGSGSAVLLVNLIGYIGGRG